MEKHSGAWAYIPEASWNGAASGPEERYGSELMERIGNTPLIRLDRCCALLSRRHAAGQG